MNRLLGRLSSTFFKLFAGIWLTILIVMGGVWSFSLIWEEVPRDYGHIDQGPIGERVVRMAMSVARWGNHQQLIDWLLDPASNRQPEVFVIDSNGQEISGRTIPQQALEQIRSGTAPVYQIRHAARHRTKHGLSEISNYRFFAVRTKLPKAGIWRTLRYTPWWVYLAAMLVVSSAVAALLAWSYARPIKKLHWAMVKASEGDFHIRIAEDIGHRYNEIGALALQFDAMAEKIQGLLQRQKRLFHDVSHELRSPLARISVALELAKKSPEHANTSLDRVSKEIQILDSLVDELLTFARLDDNAPIPFESFDLADLVASIVDDANFEGQSKNKKVFLEAPEQLLVYAHPDSIGRAIENIIRNALRFTPENETIHVSLTANPQQIQISVKDHGPGVPEEEISGLFDPFVRGKNQATGTGVGLGLAIARRAIERHGGLLQARNCKPHGLEMTIALPPLTPPSNV